MFLTYREQHVLELAAIMQRSIIYNI